MKGRPKTWDEKRRGLNSKSVPVSILSKVPKCPRRFTKEMRETWNGTAKDLIVMQCFTKQSLIPLESYCYAVANMRTLNRDKKAKPSARTAANKEVRIAAETLGLTPMAASKLRRPAQSAAIDNADDQTFAELVN